MFFALILICVPAVADFWTEGRYGAHPTACYKFSHAAGVAAAEFDTVAVNGPFILQAMEESKASQFDVHVMRAAIEFVIREDLRTPPIAKAVALSLCRGQVKHERDRNGHVPWVEQAHVNNWIGAF